MRSFFMWLLLSVLVGAFAGCADDPVKGASGTLSMNLAIGPGVDVTEIDYEIKGNGIDPITGKIAVVSNPVTAVVAGIPSGTGYTINLFTPAGASVSCSGSTTFDVIANQTATVPVQIDCGAVPGGHGTIDITAPINSCPILTSMVVSPSRVDVGGTIQVNATAKNLSQDALTYAWTATAGSFADATAAKTTYTCSVAGSQKLTIKVDNGCSDSLSVDVDCGTVVALLPPERASEPIVVSGAALPALFCVPPAQIFVFSYRQGQWKQIPHQVDERQVAHLWTGSPCPGLGCELRYVYVGEEGNGLDADDEVVFLAKDLGEPAPASAAPPEGTQGVGYQVEVTLPGGAPVGFASIYASASLAKDFGPAQVSYSRTYSRTGNELSSHDDDFKYEDTTIRTSRYRIHFSAGWILDAIEVLAGGGGDGTDLIDRWKGRAYSEQETENSWSGGAHYLGDIDGPVRAIREIQGACSWPHITRVDIFYPGRTETILNLRGHPIGSPEGTYGDVPDPAWDYPGISSYWDYNLAATPMTYYNPLIPGGTLIDGVPDPAYPSSERYPDPSQEPWFTEGWDQVDSIHGGIVFAFQADVPGLILPFFLDDVSRNDSTGEDPVGHPGVVGGNGLHLVGVGMTDPPYPPGLVRIIYWPMPADSGNVGASFFSTVQTPLGIAVTPRPCMDQCTPLSITTPCCGNGVLDGPETCDRAIPQGQPGACPTSCANDYPCMATATRIGDACQTWCVHKNPITACNNNDGCCPNGCDSTTDNDCSTLIDPVGTWTMRIQTRAEINTPQPVGLLYNANFDIIQRLVVSKSTATGGLYLDFKLEICSLNTWEDQPVGYSIDYTPILKYLNGTMMVNIDPALAWAEPVYDKIYVNSPMPELQFSLNCGINFDYNIDNLTHTGNSVDTDKDNNPGVSLTVLINGVPIVTYLGFDLTETFATTLVVDKDTFTGTVNAVIDGWRFGVEGGGTEGEATTGPLIVTPYPDYVKFTAKRLNGDVPCSEVLKNFP